MFFGNKEFKTYIEECELLFKSFMLAARVMKKKNE